MREILLKEPVELKLPAEQNMMLVLRLTTAGVVARAGLTVDRMEDVKMAVEEACNCLIDGESAPRRLCLRFAGRAMFFALIPLAVVLADLMYADLKVERGSFERKPRGH